MQFINIGYGNLVNSDKILCIVSPDSAPIHRLVSKAKENGWKSYPLSTDTGDDCRKT